MSFGTNGRGGWAALLVMLAAVLLSGGMIYKPTRPIGWMFSRFCVPVDQYDQLHQLIRPWSCTLYRTKSANSDADSFSPDEETALALSASQSKTLAACFTRPILYAGRHGHLIFGFYPEYAVDISDAAGRTRTLWISFKCESMRIDNNPPFPLPVPWIESLKAFISGSHVDRPQNAITTEGSHEREQGTDSRNKGPTDYLQ